MFHPTVSRLHSSLLVAFMTLISIGGCASLPAHTQLPGGYTLVPLARIDHDSPFDIRPDGDTIAYVRGKLLIENRATGESRTIDATPSSLAWSPDGAMLAAASIQDKNTVVRIYDPKGSVIDEALMPGHVARLAWRFDNELMAAALTMDTFKFGTNLNSILYRWPRGTKPVAVPLSDVTIMPARAHRQLHPYLEAFAFDLSPYGDEIVYTRYVEPPNFPSYQKIAVRQLGSGVEKAAAGVKGAAAGALFSSDGEHLLYGDGAGTLKRIAIWTGEERNVLTTPGRTLALSPSDRYLYADGKIYLENQEIASFPSECIGEFFPDGSRLLLKCGETLSLLSGFSHPNATTGMTDDRETLLKIRKWRSEGLISDQEYQTSKQRILAR